MRRASWLKFLCLAAALCCGLAAAARAVDATPPSDPPANAQTMRRTIRCPVHPHRRRLLRLPQPTICNPACRRPAITSRAATPRPMWIGIANSCGKRLRCEIFANVTGSRGTVLGHTVMTLGPGSSGSAAKKSYEFRVKSAGGIAQVSRQCSVLQRAGQPPRSGIRAMPAMSRTRTAALIALAICLLAGGGVAAAVNFVGLLLYVGIYQGLFPSTISWDAKNAFAKCYGAIDDPRQWPPGVNAACQAMHLCANEAVLSDAQHRKLYSQISRTPGCQGAVTGDVLRTASFLSCSAKAEHPVNAGAEAKLPAAAITGSPAFAGDDKFLLSLRKIQSSKHRSH